MSDKETIEKLTQEVISLRKQVDSYVQGPVDSKTATGELDHPESSVINLSNVSHLITKVWWEGNNVMGELVLLNTPSGKIAQEIIMAGIPLGISSRGMGSVKQLGETVEVQDDFELLCFDFVSTPSTQGAFMFPTGLSENYNPLNTNSSKYSKVNTLISDIICSQSGICCIR
jgi:hypothetical protein